LPNEVAPFPPQSHPCSPATGSGLALGFEYPAWRHWGAQSGAGRDVSARAPPHGGSRGEEGQDCARYRALTKLSAVGIRDRVIQGGHF
jgi:hypothetical protein